MDYLVPFVGMHMLQVGIVAAAAYLMLRCFSFFATNPRLSHILCAVVMLKAITPPVLASPSGVFSWILPAPQSLAELDMDETLERSRFSIQLLEVRQRQKASVPPQENSRVAGLLAEPTKQPNFPNSFFSGLFPRILTVWLIGTVGFLLFFCWRLVHFLWSIRRATQVDWPSRRAIEERLGRLSNEVANKLDMRRSIRIRVLGSSTGPAILGLRSPTVLLPRSIAEQCSNEELEALIGHELVHFQRADLWWSSVQPFALAMNWCNQLLWKLSSRMNAASENCCDQRTIEALHIEPARYARCLISVLERKHSFQATPLLPGVRPIDITKERLEGIMKLRHGSHQKQSMLTVATWMIGLATVLPGAAFTIGQEPIVDPNAKPTPIADSDGETSPRNRAA